MNQLHFSDSSPQKNTEQQQTSAHIPTNTTYQLELTISAMRFIASQLPNNYSIQPIKCNSEKSDKSKGKSKAIPTQKISKDVAKSEMPAKQKAKQCDSKPPLVAKKQIPHVTHLSYEQHEKCKKILTLLKKNKNSWPFRQPVDPVILGIPNYFDIIKSPMDLSTIEYHLTKNEYSTVTQFQADIAKIIANSFKFNHQNSKMMAITEQFQKYYNKIINEMSNSELEQTPKKNKSDLIRQKGKQKKERALLIKDCKQSKPVSVPVSVTYQDRRHLAEQIKLLPKQYIKNLREIMNLKKKGEIDLTTIEPQIILQVQEYVKDKVPYIEKKHYKQPNESSSFEVEDD